MKLEVMVSEKPEHSPQPRELRPKPAGHVWAWIIIAVGSVMFLAIALWVIVAGNVQVAGLSGHEGIHVVSSRWAERWAQAPGPPSVYVDSAEQAEHGGDHAEALRYTTMALALDPDQADLWHNALCLSLIVPDHKMAIKDAERVGVVDALLAMDGADRRLTELKDWAASGAGAAVPESALPALCSQFAKRSPLKTERQTLDTMDVSP